MQNTLDFGCKLVNLFGHETILTGFCPVSDCYHKHYLYVWSVQNTLSLSLSVSSPLCWTRMAEQRSNGMPEGYIAPNTTPKCTWSLGKHPSQSPHHHEPKKCVCVCACAHYVHVCVVCAMCMYHCVCILISAFSASLPLLLPSPLILPSPPCPPPPLPSPSFPPSCPIPPCIPT